jgi:hypothetical protein
MLAEEEISIYASEMNKYKIFIGQWESAINTYKKMKL